MVLLLISITSHATAFVNYYVKKCFASIGEDVKEGRSNGEEHPIMPQIATIIEDLLRASSFYALL